MNLHSQIEFNSQPKQIDVLLFTRHLATMLKAGISISEALLTICDQVGSATFKKIIKEVLRDVENGQTLAKSLAQHPRVFNQFYVSLIEVSEESGSLDQNLEFIAQQLAKSYGLKKKIQGALLYPMLIFSVAIIVGGFISFFILPQLVDFFQTLDVELPIATKVLLFIANTFKNFGIHIAVVSGITLVSFNAAIKTKLIKPLWDAFVLHLPVIGTFVKASQLAQFSRNLGILVKSGVPLSKAVDITAHTLSNEKYKTDLLQLGIALTHGKNISSAIEKGRYHEFPPLVSKMIAIGEKTGNLDESLLYLGDFYEDEIDAISKNLTTILEPALLVTIGAIVAFVALAIITPIYELTGSIRR